MKHYEFIINHKHYMSLVRVTDRKTAKYLKQRLKERKYLDLETLTFIELGELEQILKDYNLERLIPIIQDKKPYKKEE